MIRSILFGLAVAIFASGCGGGLSTYEHYEQRGFTPTSEYKLLNLKYVDLPESHSEWSAGAFLFFGAAGGSSDSEVKGKVGFVFTTPKGITIMERFDAEKIDYRLDKNAATPYVRFYVDNDKYSFESDWSLTQNIEENTDRLMISLAPKDFSEDIAVLKYAGLHG